MSAFFSGSPPTWSWVGILRDSPTSAFYQVTASGNPVVDNDSAFWGGIEPNGGITNPELCTFVVLATYLLADAPCNWSEQPKGLCEFEGFR